MVSILSALFFSGGSNTDIEREGGMNPGELPLLPWARELRDADEPAKPLLPKRWLGRGALFARLEGFFHCDCTGAVGSPLIH